MGDSYLVTGGAGFIGSNIVKKLVSSGHSVRVLDNFCYGFEKNLCGDIELVRGDVSDMDTAQKAVRDIDYVLHQAAIAPVPDSIKDPLGTHRANLTGTLNILEASGNSSVKKLVFASSAAIYGNGSDTAITENCPIDPLSPYAVQKYAGELYVKNYYELYGLKTATLRYFNIFGPNQNVFSDYGAVIPKFISIMRKGNTPTIYGDGNQSRDFLYVENAVSANLLAAKSKAAGIAVNIGGGVAVTVNELAGKINKILGTSITPKHAPARKGDVRHSLADITLARRLIGFAPKITFDDGLKRTISCTQKTKV